jgi:cytochrome c biogenesis protein
VVELGGLARTDRAGYGEEFGRLAADLAPSRGDVEDPGPPAPSRPARDDDGEDDDAR